MIEERLARVRERVAEAARNAGRRPDEITIVAVSKVKPASDIVAVPRTGGPAIPGPAVALELIPRAPGP